jgi:hypothetical protein
MMHTQNRSSTYTTSKYIDTSNMHYGHMAVGYFIPQTQWYIYFTLYSVVLCASWACGYVLYLMTDPWSRQKNDPAKYICICTLYDIKYVYVVHSVSALCMTLDIMCMHFTLLVWWKASWLTELNYPGTQHEHL